MPAKGSKRLFSLAAIFLFFAAAEGGARAVYFFSHARQAWPAREESSFSRFTLSGLHEYIPGSEIPLEPLGYPARSFGVGRYGFVHNGEDKPLEEKDFVIVLLGGSTVEGRGASSNAATIAAFLEQILNEKLPGRSFRVLNGGHTGYIAYQEWLLLHGKILADFKPSMVLALDGRNDGANLVQYAGHGWKPNWVPYADEITRQVNAMIVSGGPSPVEALAFWLKRHSFLAERADRFFQKPRGPFYFPGDEKPIPSLLDQAAEAYFQNHALAFTACRRKHIPYYVFLQPALLMGRKTLTEKDKKLQKYWDRYYRKEIYWESLEGFYSALDRSSAGIPYFYNLSGAFKNEPGQLYFDSCHYTDAGNRLIAEKIATAIDPELRPPSKDF